MARSSRLKVFRVPIGFHDAYVAAPSQKAAIEAWGSDRDVFARGEAELVTDPTLTAEPLARPGEVMKRLRGTAAEQLAALPPNKATAAPRRTEGRPEPRRQAKRARTAAPRPSRAALERAETALAQAGDKREAALKRLREQEAALVKERAKLEKAHGAELEKLKTKRDKAAAAYEQAMERWRSS